MERKIYKGDLYYAQLDGTIGSEQSGRRPVVIVQNDIGNKYSPTVIIVPLTKRIEWKSRQPTHYYLKPFGNIKYDSMILTEQIRVIDKRRLREYLGRLSLMQIKELDKNILIALGINEK